jgi:hypothetical protein
MALTCGFSVGGRWPVTAVCERLADFLRTRCGLTRRWTEADRPPRRAKKNSECGLHSTWVGTYAVPLVAVAFVLTWLLREVPLAGRQHDAADTGRELTAAAAPGTAEPQAVGGR